MHWDNFQTLEDYYPDFAYDLECEVCGEVFHVDSDRKINMVLVSLRLNDSDNECVPICPGCETWGI